MYRKVFSFILVSILISSCSTFLSDTESASGIKKKVLRQNMIACQSPDLTTKVTNIEEQPYRAHSLWSSMFEATIYLRSATEEYFKSTGSLPNSVVDLGFSEGHTPVMSEICAFSFRDGTIQVAGTKNLGVGYTSIWEPVPDVGGDLKWHCRTNVKIFYQDRYCPLDAGIEMYGVATE